jgi:hypothetical protein
MMWCSTFNVRGSVMAKGQQRSHREAKKPKKTAAERQKAAAAKAVPVVDKITPKK